MEIMHKNVKSSLAILKQELRLQFVSVGFIFMLFLATMLLIKYQQSGQNELSKLFIMFYTFTVGFALPWQVNTKGHIAPEYCRYNLNMPVGTWQLSILPLLCRLFLIFLFIGLELLLHTLLYGWGSNYYLTPDAVRFSIKTSLLVYFTLQAFAWSKDSFRNLFLWFGLGLGICAFYAPEYLLKVLDDDWRGTYWTLILFLTALALLGVRNLRRGNILALPGFKSLVSCFSVWLSVASRQYRSATTAYVHQLWRRSWYFMPLFALTFICIIHLVTMKFWLKYDFDRDFLFIMVVYAVLTVVSPLFGIMYVDGKAFDSSYTNNLPLGSAQMAKAKLKCFSLSYAISLGVFLSWIAYKLIFNAYFMNAVRARGEMLLQFPSLLVWMFLACIIWSFALAFVIVSGYIRYRIFTFSILGIMILLLVYHGLPQNNILNLYLKFPYRSISIGYIIILASANFMLFGKLCMGFIRRGNLLVTSVAVILVFIASSIFTIICCRYSTAMFCFPLTIVFVFYPIIGLTHVHEKKRHEMDLSRGNIPWKSGAVLLGVILCFNLYVSWVDYVQQKELKAITDKCENAANKFYPYTQPEMSGREFVETYLPQKEKLMPELSGYIKKISRKAGYNNMTYNDHVGYYLRSKIYDVLKHKRYDDVLNIYLFNLKNWQLYGSQPSVDKYIFDQIIRNRQLSEGDLREIKQLYRNILRKMLALNKRGYAGVIKRMKRIQPQMTFFASQNEIILHSYRMSMPGYQSDSDQYPRFSQVFLQPLCVNADINLLHNMLAVINAINYIQSGQQQFFTNQKINTGLVANNYYSLIACNRIINSIVEVALLQYRDKYGKEPQTLRQMVPEFLDENELYLFADWGYAPVLRINSIEDIRRHQRRRRF